jgi:hypothetical protein
MILTSIPNHLQKKQKKPMAAKQVPSKAEKKHRNTAEKTAQPRKHIRKTAQPPKHIRKNCETTTEKTNAEETTAEKTT